MTTQIAWDALLKYYRYLCTFMRLNINFLFIKIIDCEVLTDQG